MLNDEELLRRLETNEDHFVERKTSKDDKGWLRTAIAFANSAPPQFPCVLYIGVTRTGEVEANLSADEIQKAFNGKLKAAYPPIAYLCRTIRRNGREALAIVVYGSESKPHFAGHSYVRVGSETVRASKIQYDELIAQRNSKARKILEWKNRPIFVVFLLRTGLFEIQATCSCATVINSM